MRTMVTVPVLLILLNGLAYADTDRAPAAALEWWLRSQGKFEGAEVNTAETPQRKYRITNFKVAGLTQPTDVELEAIMDQYEAAMVVKKEQDKIDTEKVLAKVKLDKAELTLLKKAIQEA